MSLITIRPGVTLRDDAAASFVRLERALGRQVDVNRTTESWSDQMQRYAAWLAYQNGTGPKTARALHPRDSLHVYKPDTDKGGTAWDTDERGGVLDEHGWIADVAGEPWHREYRISHDQHLHDTVRPYTEEDDMADTRSIITASAAGVKYELLRGSKRSISKAEWDAMRACEKQGGPKLAVATVPQATLDAIPGK